MPHVGQRKDRLTAVALTASHRGDCPGRRNGGLRGVADAVRLDALHDRVPADGGAAVVVSVGHLRLGGLPAHVIHVVDRALYGRERSALLRQLDAGLHGVIAHELHHLRAELLPLGGAVAHAGVVHQVRQAHDAQADAARPVGRLGQMRHGGHVGVGLHHVIQEARGRHHALPQAFPIDLAVRGAVLVQVDRAETAILIGPEPLFPALVRDDTICHDAVGLRLGQVEYVGQASLFDHSHSRLESFRV